MPNAPSISRNKLALKKNLEVEINTLEPSAEWSLSKPLKKSDVVPVRGLLTPTVFHLAGKDVGPVSGPPGGLLTPVRSGTEVYPEATLLQNVEGNFSKVCIDSGAGESVCPEEAFPDYATYKTNKNGCKYRAAGGQELVNVGEKRPHFVTNGVKTSMTFQATTGVKKPLAAASRIAAKGNRIVLEGEGSSSYIENKATGKRIPIKLENGIYMMEMQVSEPPFTRPA